MINYIRRKIYAPLMGSPLFKSLPDHNHTHSSDHLQRAAGAERRNHYLCEELLTHTSGPTLSRVLRLECSKRETLVLYADSQFKIKLGVDLLKTSPRRDKTGEKFLLLLGKYYSHMVN